MADNPTTAVQRVYGADDLYSPRMIAAYLQQLQRADRAAAGEIEDAAAALETIIKHSAPAAVALGMGGGIRARTIVEPLTEAANAHFAAAKLAQLCWTRFYRVFGEHIEATRRTPKNKRMNWEDS